MAAAIKEDDSTELTVTISTDDKVESLSWALISHGQQFTEWNTLTEWTSNEDTHQVGYLAYRVTIIMIQY